VREGKGEGWGLAHWQWFQCKRGERRKQPERALREIHSAVKQRGVSDAFNEWEQSNETNNQRGLPTERMATVKQRQACAFISRSQSTFS